MVAVGEAVSGCAVIQSPTVPAMSPEPTARRTSRSVMMPVRRVPSVTRIAPTRRSAIRRAASVSASPAAAVSRFELITAATNSSSDRL